MESRPSTEKLPHGFVLAREELPHFNGIRYEYRPPIISFTTNVSEEVDVHSDYVEQTTRYAMRVIARKMIEVGEAVLGEETK